MKKNGSNSSKISINPTLVNNLIPFGIQFERNTIAYGENECAGIAITGLPSPVTYEWLTEVCNLSNTITAITYVPEDNVESILKDISNMVSANQLKAKGAVNTDPVERIRAQKIVDDGTKLLEQIANNNQSIGYMGIQVLVIGRDKANVQNRVQAVKNKYIGRRFRASVLSFFQKELFQAVSPCNAIEPTIQSISGHLIPMRSLLGGFPFAFTGYNDGQGCFYGMDAAGAPVIVDHWRRDQDRTSSNIVMMGATGIGKSTALKSLLENEWDLGTKILIIDPQGEYKPLCQALNGDWIDIAGGMGGRVNILQIYEQAPAADTPERLSPLARHINNLEVFFRIYLDLSEVQVALLKECLELTYKDFHIDWDTDIQKKKPENFPVLSDLYELVGRKAEEYEKTLSRNEQNQYKDLQLLLRNIALGADSKIWNGISTINPSKDFVVFDTSGVNNTSHNIRSALYHTVLNYCEEYLYRNPHERVVLVVDEAHTVIDRRIPDTVTRLARIAKTCRKYESAIWVCSQQLVDFLDPAIKKEGSALLDQPNIKLLLPVGRGQDLQELKELYQLTDAEEERMVAGQRGKGLLFIGSRRLSLDVTVPQFRLADMGGGGGR